MVKRMGKRLIAFVLAVVFSVALVPTMPAMAATSGECGDNLTWTLDDEGTLIISGTGDMWDWSSANWTPWYEKNNGYIDTVLIENGVTTIGADAFYSCYSLTSITIPDSVTTIGVGAFFDCYSLTSITIPDSVTTIGDYAFRGCDSLTSITIPNSVTTIGNSAFYSCTSLTSIEIPDSVTSIGNSAFSYCDSLTSIEIPDSVMTIGDYAFSYCDSLTSIEIPDSVTTIGARAFYSCTSLTSIEIPNSVTIIGDYAFSYCDSLTDVYYAGTEEEWSEIGIGASNSDLTSATITYNYGVKVDENAGKNGDYNSYLTGIYAPTSTGKSYGVTKLEYTEEGKVHAAAQAFYKASNEYLEAVKSEAKKGGASQDAIEVVGEQLYNDDENSKYKYFIFNVSSGRDLPIAAKKAAYMALAEYFNTGITTDKGEKLKIDLDDEMFMIDANLTKQILSSLGRYTKTTQHNGYDVTLNLSSFMGAFTGNITVQNSNYMYNGLVNSKPEEVTSAMNLMLVELRDLTDEVTKQAYTSLISEIGNITGFNEWFRVEMTDKLKSALKTLRKKGFGNVLEITKRCYDGYEIAKKLISIKDAKLTNLKELNNALSDAQGMYDKIKGLKYTDSAVDNFVIKQALSKLERARADFEDSLRDYIYDTTGNPPKNAFDKAIDWISEKVTNLWNIKLQCPVDFEVHSKDGELLGYVKDGEVWCTNDIYIETSGDVKYLFVPEGMEVDIKMTGTDKGELNYVVEEFSDGIPTGRLNYYSIPLTDGAELTQSINVDTLSSETDSLPIVTDEGNINADEYLSADTDAFITVRAEPDKYGNALGSGNYIKGDNVELTAVPIDDYSFYGWYIDDVLVCADIVYRFTARENVTVRAEFARAYIADMNYTTNMSSEYEDNMYAFVYENADGTRGIIAEPFEENPSEDITLYCSTYDKRGNLILDNKEYSLVLSEDCRYNLEKVVSSEAVRVELTDESGNTIAEMMLENYDIAEGVYIDTVGKYRNSMQVTAANTDGVLEVELDIIDAEVTAEDVTVYAAQYDGDSLVSVVILAPSVSEEKIVYSGNITSYTYKIFVWDKDFVPVTYSYENN